MRHLTIAILLLLMFSCSTLKKVVINENRIALTDQNIHLLDGNYYFMTVDSGYRYLDYLILNKSIFKREDKDKCYVRVEAINSNLITFKFFRNSELIEQKNIKGILKDGYFELKHSLRINFYLIVNGCSEQKSRIGLLKNKNLIADTKGSACALLVFFPLMCSDSEEYEQEYRRIE